MSCHTEITPKTGITEILDYTVFLPPFNTANFFELFPVIKNDAIRIYCAACGKNAPESRRTNLTVSHHEFRLMQLEMVEELKKAVGV